MEFRVLNVNLIAIGILDTLESVVINERYSEPGDIEIYTKFTFEAYALLKKDHYLVSSSMNSVMIIESVQIKTDHEDGDKLIVKGRSFESTLDRRIVLKQIIVDGSLQTAIQTILNQNVIACEFPQRNFPNFIFSASSDAYIVGLTMKAQFYTENVLDIIMDICNESSLGFKVRLNASNQFVFSLYYGADRSHAQLVNPFVIFSADFDNLINSDYYESKRNRKNWAFIAGEEGLLNWNSGYYGRWAQIDTFSDYGNGLHLREIFVDASGLATTDYETSTPIPDADYISQLEQIGYQELAKHQEIVAFNAEVDLSKTYKYGVDFFLGDIIQYVDNYGHSTRARISEVTISESLSGSNIYPTLTSV